MPRLLMLVLLVTAIVTGCYAEPIAVTTFPPEPTPTESSDFLTPAPTPAPTPSAQITASPIRTATPPAPTTASPVPPSPSPAASAAAGPPSVGCINGWTSPLPGMLENDEGLAILEGHMGIQGPWTVTEMRYFIGPDSVGVIEPRFDVVERWYIRAALLSDPDFRGRWLLEKRTDLIQGVSAVAPWESSGYESPDWTGFVGDGEPQDYLGLPGQWAGIPYDFVTGEGDSGNPGLPPEVVDCLAAT